MEVLSVVLALADTLHESRFPTDTAMFNQLLYDVSAICIGTYNIPASSAIYWIGVNIV